MIATIQNISSSKFSLNGLEYNKSFIALKVGDNYIRVVSVYDTRLELVATTHFNQVQVGGTVHTSANNLINALTDVLFSKAESSGGGLEPGGDFTGTLNVGTGATTKYNDYLSGSSVNLALSTSKVAGSYATVRIKGSLTGSWPSTWKVSGDAKSSSADNFNELSIAYFADDDIRGVNRVYSIAGAPAGDTTAPSVPTGLTSPAKTSTTIDLSWNASTDAVGVTGYMVYKNGVYEKEVGGTTAQVTGLTASTAYSFTVAAIDAARNESAQSAALSVTTEASQQTLNSVSDISPEFMYHPFDFASTGANAHDDIRTTSTDQLSTTLRNLTTDGMRMKNDLGGVEATFFNGASSKWESATGVSGLFQGSFSIFMKIAPMDGQLTGVTQTLLSSSNYSTYSSRVEIALMSDGKLDIFYRAEGSALVQARTANAVFADGAATAFKGIDVVFESGVGIKIYVNGTLQALDAAYQGSLSGYNMATFSHSSPVTLGMRNNANFYHGYMRAYTLQPVAHTDSHRTFLASL